MIGRQLVYQLGLSEPVLGHGVVVSEPARARLDRH